MLVWFRLCIQWQKNGTYESDEILVNIIPEPTPTCTSIMGKMKLSKWKHCAGNTNKKQCEATCGLSTGGNPNVLRRYVSRNGPSSNALLSLL